MKKISNILLAVTFALPLFTACETDNDSNPILNEPDTFTLNTPAHAANNVYDLKECPNCRTQLVRNRTTVSGSYHLHGTSLI